MDGDEWFSGAERVDLDLLRSEVARMAQLALMEYEAERAAAAKRLNVRTSFLDKEVEKARPKAPVDDAEGEIVETLEPWLDPVDGASLAEEVRARLVAHVVFAGAADADAAALWVFGSYLMDTWRLWPRLMITSPTKQCGKSTLLEVLDALAHRGLIVSNTKSAGVFRAIEAWRPTLLFDEADTWMKEDVELAGILNSGHTRRTARVIRVQEKNGEMIPTLFSTWAPMVIAGIGSQRDTLTSRSVVIGLRRKLASEAVERLPHDLHARMLRVRRQIARWTADNAVRLGAMACEPPECGNDRRRDNFTPLWRVAQALGGRWPDRIATAYAVQAAAEDEADEPAALMMLRDVAAIAEETSAWKIKTADLVARLIEMEGRPWADWRHGRPITGHSLARQLAPFGVKARKHRFGESTFQGYDPSEIREAFARYCRDTPSQSGTPEQGLDNNALPWRRSGTSAAAVPEPEHPKPLKERGCSGVPLSTALREAFEAKDDPNNPEAW